MLKMSKLKEAVPSIKNDQAQSCLKMLFGAVVASIGICTVATNAYQMGVDEALIKVTDNLEMDK